MGFLDNIKKRLRGKSSMPASGGRSTFGAGDANAYWVYVRCGRCGEPLRARINLMNDPSQEDDSANWIVRKGISGSGARLCFQTVEVTLKLDAKKQKILESEAVGGELITAEEYAALKQEASNP